MFDQVLGGVPTPLKLFIALAAVIALIVIAAWLTKRFGGQRLGSVAMSGRSRQPRLGVLDVLAVDGRRRLVIVRRDNVEHLVMIGGPNDLVVESGILRIPSGGTTATQQREPTTVIPQREPTTVIPEAGAPRPAPPPQPARVAPSVPAAAPPQPLRPVEQPVRAPRVEAPSIVPSSSATAAPFTPPPPPSKGPAAPKPAPLPAAPTISSVTPAPVRTTSPAPAAPPSPAEPAPAKPFPSPVSTAAPIAPSAPPSPLRPAAAAAAAGAAAIAGTGVARVTGIASPSDIAERLAAALKRPVVSQSRAPEPVKPEPARIEPIDEPEIAGHKPAVEAKNDDYAAPEIIAPAQDPDEPSAPEVKPEQRPALADATEPAEDDGDPFSLEADLAALLGRDMGKSKD